MCCLSCLSFVSLCHRKIWCIMLGYPITSGWFWQFLFNWCMAIDIKVHLGLQKYLEFKPLREIQQKSWNTSFIFVLALLSDNYKSDYMWWDASKVAVVFVCMYLLLVGMLYLLVKGEFTFYWGMTQDIYMRIWNAILWYGILFTWDVSW